MIFLLVFDIDVCPGMVVARFISITSLTHLKNLNNTQEDLHSKLYNILWKLVLMELRFEVKLLLIPGFANPGGHLKS